MESSLCFFEKRIRQDAGTGETSGTDITQNMELTTDNIKKRLKSTGPVVENDFRHYAVLIPIVETDDGPGLLYEVRGQDLDRQPGEICFPGGEVEEGEDYAECAIRETEEEIGVPSEHIEILDELTTIYGVGRFAMHCFPAILDPKAMDFIEINEEVDEVFTVSLKKLMDTELELFHASVVQEGPEDFPYDRVTGEDSYPWSRMRSPVPVYDVGERVIWGLTGRATKVLLDVLEEASS